MNALVALFQSRKFFVGMLTIIATVAAVVLRTAGAIPADAMVPTIISITTIGLGVIGSIGWEDAASKGAGGSAAPAPVPATTNTINVATEKKE